MMIDGKGHLEQGRYSAGQDGSYGGGYPLEQLKEALEKALRGYRGGQPLLKDGCQQDVAASDK